MKWFKHMTDMLEDTFVVLLMDEFGIEGYGIWVGILEIYAKYADENCGQKIEIPYTVVEQKLRVRRAKVERVLSFCSTSGKLSYTKNRVALEIEIPKMAELKDEWTQAKKKNSGVAREKLPYKKEEEEEEDIKKAASQLQKSGGGSESKNQGHLFTIKRPGFQGDEKEWLRRLIIEDCAAKKRPTNPDDSIELLQISHSYAAKIISRWFLQPIERRMAAYVYTIMDSTAKDELAFALRAAEENWEGIQKYLPQVQAMLAKNDREVILDV